MKAQIVVLIVSIISYALHFSFIFFAFIDIYALIFR